MEGIPLSGPFWARSGWRGDIPVARTGAPSFGPTGILGLGQRDSIAGVGKPPLLAAPRLADPWTMGELLKNMQECQEGGLSCPPFRTGGWRGDILVARTGAPSFGPTGTHSQGQQDAEPGVGKPPLLASPSLAGPWTMGELLKNMQECQEGGLSCPPFRTGAWRGDILVARAGAPAFGPTGILGLGQQDSIAGVGKPPLLAAPRLAGPWTMGELLKNMQECQEGGLSCPPFRTGAWRGDIPVARAGAPAFGPTGTHGQEQQDAEAGVGKFPLLASQGFAGPWTMGELLKNMQECQEGGLSCPPCRRGGRRGDILVARTGAPAFGPTGTLGQRQQDAEAGVGKPPLLASPRLAGPWTMGELLKNMQECQEGGLSCPPCRRGGWRGDILVARAGAPAFGPTGTLGQGQQDATAGVGKPPLLAARNLAGPCPVGELFSDGSRPCPS